METLPEPRFREGGQVSSIETLNRRETTTLGRRETPLSFYQRRKVRTDSPRLSEICPHFDDTLQDLSDRGSRDEVGGRSSRRRHRRCHLAPHPLLGELLLIHQ